MIMHGLANFKFKRMEIFLFPFPRFIWEKYVTKSTILYVQGL
jgi:hypothetical protein